jgi:hypothetical protein
VRADEKEEGEASQEELDFVIAQTDTDYYFQETPKENGYNEVADAV